VIDLKCKSINKRNTVKKKPLSTRLRLFDEIQLERQKTSRYNSQKKLYNLSNLPMLVTEDDIIHAKKKLSCNFDPISFNNLNNTIADNKVPKHQKSNKIPAPDVKSISILIQ